MNREESLVMFIARSFYLSNFPDSKMCASSGAYNYADFDVKGYSPKTYCKFKWESPGVSSGFKVICSTVNKYGYSHTEAGSGSIKEVLDEVDKCKVLIKFSEDPGRFPVFVNYRLLSLLKFDVGKFLKCLFSWFARVHDWKCYVDSYAFKVNGVKKALFFVSKSSYHLYGPNGDPEYNEIASYFKYSRSVILGRDVDEGVSLLNNASYKMGRHKFLHERCYAAKLNEITYGLDDGKLICCSLCSSGKLFGKYNFLDYGHTYSLLLTSYKSDNSIFSDEYKPGFFKKFDSEKDWVSNITYALIGFNYLKLYRKEFVDKVKSLVPSDCNINDLYCCVGFLLMELDVYDCKICRTRVRGSDRLKSYYCNADVFMCKLLLEVAQSCKLVSSDDMVKVAALCSKFSRYS